MKEIASRHAEKRLVIMVMAGVDAGVRDGHYAGMVVDGFELAY